MSEIDAVHDLPYLTWLGVKVYASEIQTSWQHRLPEFEYAYVDTEAHDNTGRKSLKVKTVLQFLNTIEPGMFPGKWRQFRDILLSGQSGTLKHPDIGSFYARVAEGDYKISPEKTAGIEVNVTWTESLKSVDEPTQIVTSKSDVTASAAKIDSAIAAIPSLSYPDGFGKESFVDQVVDLFAEGTTLGLELDGLINQTIGYVDAVYQQMQIAAKTVQFAADDLKDAIANDPARWLLETACDALRRQLKEKQQATQQGGRQVKTVTAANDTTIALLSLELNADISGIVQLNPKLVKSPTVDKGTVVKYFVEV